MKFIIDMNLSPAWADVLRRHSFDARHWIEVGRPADEDATILRWAREHGHVVLTHDLDFSALLALSAAGSPSLLQLRIGSIDPSDAEPLVVGAIRLYRSELERGSIVVVEPGRSRARILPLDL